MINNNLGFNELNFTPYSEKKALSSQLFLAIEENNIDIIKKLFEISSNDSIKKALCIRKYTIHGLNVFSFAAHKNNVSIVRLIAAKALELGILNKVLTLVDQSYWNAFHHLALMEDDCDCYKEIKKLSGIKPKKITKFYCESPSFLRQCLKENPKRFSSSLKIYVRSGPPNDRKEVKLNFDELLDQYGDQFTVKPKQFRLIPYGTNVYFSYAWQNSDYRSRDETLLAELDALLLRIRECAEESGLAITPLTHNDKGEPISVKVGMGVETLRKFKARELTTPYGGRMTYEFNIINEYTYDIDDDYTADGENFRSYGSTLPHSFPNVYWNDISTILGPITCQRVLEDTPEGTCLALDYGAEYFYKKFTPIELRPKAAESYIPGDPNIYSEHVRISYLKERDGSQSN